MTMSTPIQYYKECRFVAVSNGKLTKEAHFMRTKPGKNRDGCQNAFALKNPLMELCIRISMELFLIGLFMDVFIIMSCCNYW